MITDTASVPVALLERETGWLVKDVGACREDVCVPLPAGALVDDRVDLTAFAERMRMPLLHDEEHGLWSLGPQSGGPAMTTVQAPDVVLPTLTGEPFPLAALRGKKVLIAAWASW